MNAFVESMKFFVFSFREFLYRRKRVKLRMTLQQFELCMIEYSHFHKWMIITLL